MSSNYTNAKSIRITKPTYEEASLRIVGSGTYQLRSTFREKGFSWNSNEKVWEYEFYVVEGVTTADLENVAIPLIDDITIAASLEGIRVDVTDNAKNTNKSNKNTKASIIDYDSIKNINKTYPDGTKMHATTIKYFRDYSFDSDGEDKLDTISATLNNDRIELRGSTYYNRAWLKSTFGARFDKQTRVWHIPNGDNHVLKQIERILIEFGMSRNRNDTFITQMMHMGNRNKNKKSSIRNKNKHKRLKRRRISTSSDEESESDDDYDIEYDDKYPQPALKRRRIIMEESDDESILEIDSDSDYVVEDEHDSIEYVSESEDKPNNSNKQDTSQEISESNTNVKVDNDDKKTTDENQQDEQENECVICFDAKKEYLCVPCGHLCLCEGCKDSVKQCPLCRAKFATVIKLFK